VTEMFTEADDKFFGRVLGNNNHVLQQYLSERLHSQYNTRSWPQQNISSEDS